MDAAADRQARRLAMIDFPTPVESLTRLKVPKSFNGRNPQMRRDLAGVDPDPQPELPADVVAKTRDRYVEAYERLTGRPFDA